MREDTVGKFESKCEGSEILVPFGRGVGRSVALGVLGSSSEGGETGVAFIELVAREASGDVSVLETCDGPGVVALFGGFSGDFTSPLFDSSEF